MKFFISVALESMLVVGRTVFRMATALLCTTTETNTLANSGREHLPLQKNVCDVCHREGFKNGYGVFEVANGDVYSGDFKNGKRYGIGIERFYTGER